MNAWPKIALGEIARPKQWPVLPRSEMHGGKFPVYGANGRIGFASKFTHEKPTLLIGCRGSCGSVHVTEPYSYATGNAMALDELNKSRADIQYLCHFFRHRGFQDVITGTSQPQIIQQNLVRVEVPLPPLPEQRRIAAILDHADALRAKRRAALARLDEMAQAIFVEMFGPPPYSETVALHECVEDFRYGTSEKSASDGRPTLRIPNVISGTINLNDLRFVPVSDIEFQRLSLRQEDILFVRTNGNPDYVGRCATVQSNLGADCNLRPSDFAYASYLIRARLKAELLDPVFLCAFLSMKAGRKQIRERAKTSAGQFNINTDGLGSLHVPRMTFAAQTDFRSMTEGLNVVRGLHHQHTAALDTLFASLQHRAFTGAL